MTATKRHPLLSGWKPIRLVCSSLLVLGVGASLVADQAAAPPTLTLSVKGSTAYASPTPVALQTALVVITPAWGDITAKSPVGGKEASGQLLLLSDLVVVLSNKSMDCTTAFASRQVATDQEFVILAGRAEAYTGQQGYHNTPIGKVVVDTSGAAVSLPLDRFSVDATYTAQRRKSLSRDNVRGNDGRLILQRTGGDWVADFMLRADDIMAEGKVPLTLCPLTERKKAAGAPLLGEKRLLRIADQYGM